MSLLNSFNIFLQEHNQIQKKQILLAVSGGIDSVVLADLFKKFYINFAIVHCNFQLRGKDSNQDEAFVAELAKNLEVPYFNKSFDTLTYQKEEGVSTQIAARELRYAWFGELLSTTDYHFLATAHHANDQLETIIFNLTKGTGIKGLKGILPISGKIIRPLLSASKKHILEYATKEGLGWREDVSNDSLKYKRNLIRHKVVPVLEQINQSLTPQLHLTTERLQASSVIVEHYCNEFSKKNVLITSEGEIKIAINELLKSVSPLLILSEILQPYGFNYKQIKQLYSHIEGHTGKIYYSASHELLVDRKYLLIRKIIDDTLPKSAKIEDETNEIEFSGLTLRCNFSDLDIKDKIAKSPKKLTIDASLISFPLTIRYWQTGDYFVPFGMKGKKKVSDYLTDKKLSLFEKEKVKVLCMDDKIIWVVGLRPDNRFKVSINTKKIYTVEVI